MLELGLKPEQVRSQDTGFIDATSLGLSSEMRIEIPHFAALHLPLFHINALSIPSYSEGSHSFYYSPLGKSLSYLAKSCSLYLPEYHHTKY